MKDRYKQLEKSSEGTFIRSTGIKVDDFTQTAMKIREYIATQQALHPIHRRGLKTTVDVENRLLLTLLYLRDYPTFLKLGESFGISESYSNKIYHQTLDILIKVGHIPNHKELLDVKIEAISIDVTEDPIERPMRNQKAYYSGKKKDTQSKHS